MNILFLLINMCMRTLFLVDRHEPSGIENQEVPREESPYLLNRMNLFLKILSEETRKEFKLLRRKEK